MKNTLGTHTANATLKLGLAALALAFLHAPSAKAQDCCPDADQYNTAAPAKADMLASAQKPAQPAANSQRHAKSTLVAKAAPAKLEAAKLEAANLEPTLAPGTQPSRNHKSNAAAKVVLVKQPAKTLDNQQ